MSDRQIVFLLNLLQDVNIIRPLVFLAARDLRLPTRILVTTQFVNRDKTGTWSKELEEIRQATGVDCTVLTNHEQAIGLLAGRSGVIIAASESNLPAHKPVHDIFIEVPASFLKVTIQHGFESVGLLQSRDHDRAHGKKVEFAADVVCVWMVLAVFRSLLPSQRSKLYVTGPTAILQMKQPDPNLAHKLDRGIVCENLHSVRLRISGDLKGDFLTNFFEFCFHESLHGHDVTLRPHPGGQFAVKNKVTLPDNVAINNNPIYKVDLRRYAYGISAPSSIIIDMILAGIPTAVWCDKNKAMDASNYDGLTLISTVSDWIEFAHQARKEPMHFIEMQERFIQKFQIPTDPKLVYERYAKLFDPTLEVAR